MLKKKEEDAGAYQGDACASDVVGRHQGEDGKGQILRGGFFICSVEKDECQKRKGEKWDFGHDLVREIEQGGRNQAQQAGGQRKHWIGVEANEFVGQWDRDGKEQDHEAFERDQAAGKQDVGDGEQERKTEGIFGVWRWGIAQGFRQAMTGGQRAAQVDELGVVAAER